MDTHYAISNWCACDRLHEPVAPKRCSLSVKQRCTLRSNEPADVLTWWTFISMICGTGRRPSSLSSYPTSWSCQLLQGTVPCRCSSAIASPTRAPLLQSSGELAGIGLLLRRAGSALHALPAFFLHQTRRMPLRCRRGLGLCGEDQHLEVCALACLFAYLLSPSWAAPHPKAWRVNAPLSPRSRSTDIHRCEQTG